MRRKVGAYIKINKQSVEVEPEHIDWLKNKIRASLKKATPKGYVPTTPVKFKSGQAHDDFMYNLITVLGEQFIIKAPRIVSNKYHKK
jgi:hypothetical protein